MVHHAAHRSTIHVDMSKRDARGGHTYDMPAGICGSRVIHPTGRIYNLGSMLNQTTAGQYWTPAGITDCPTGRSLAHAHKLFMCCSTAVRRPDHMNSSSERLPEHMESKSKIQEQLHRQNTARA